MKAQKLKVIKGFLNKVEGQIINPPRLDVAKSLIEQGYCEWIVVDATPDDLGNQKVGEPVIIEPKNKQDDNSNIPGENDSNGSKQGVGTDKPKRGRKGNKAKA